MLQNGHVDEAIAVLVALDCYLREQDWLALRAEDVVVEDVVEEDVVEDETETAPNITMMLANFWNELAHMKMVPQTTCQFIAEEMLTISKYG